MKPDPKIGEFELVNILVKQTRRSWWLSVILLVMTCAFAAMTLLVVLRPVPVVVRSDDPMMQALVVRSGATEIRDVDAKRFFVNMAARLHGWNSANAISAFSEATRLMTSTWREHYKTELLTPRDVDTTIDPSGKQNFLEQATQARISNEFEFDWSSVKCAKRDEDGLWYCHGKASIVQQPLLGNPVDENQTKKRYRIRARFWPVPTTLQTIDGLLVDFWEAKELD